MKFLESLEEQAALGFTGRINVLRGGRGEYLGAVVLCGGNLVNAFFQGNSGRETLYRIFLSDLKASFLRFVVEPEVVDSGDICFNMTIGEFKKKAREFYRDWRENETLRPPGHVRVSVSGDFVKRGGPVGGLEFDVMVAVAEFGRIRDVYGNMSCQNHEITRALVALRKKGALKVLKGGLL